MVNIWRLYRITLLNKIVYLYKEIIRHILKEQISSDASGYGRSSVGVGNRKEEVGKDKTNPQRCMHKYNLVVLGGKSDAAGVTSDSVTHGHYGAYNQEHSIFYEGEYKWVKAIGNPVQEYVSKGMEATMLYQFSSTDLGDNEHKMGIGFKWTMKVGNAGSKKYTDVQFLWDGSYSCEGTGRSDNQGGNYGYINNLSFKKSLVSWWANQQYNPSKTITTTQLNALKKIPEFNKIYTACMSAFNITSKVSLGDFQNKVKNIKP